MNTVEHRARGQTYKFTGANADLWQIATEQPRLFQGEALDELARALGSMDDNERVAASKKIITGLWAAHASLGPYPFLDCLSKFEFDRYFHHKYRDHVCHQLKVYLLGLGILGCTHPIRDEVERLVGNDVDRIWLVTAVFHDLGYVIENDRAHPGAESWERVCKSYRDVMRNPLKQIIEDEGLSELTEQQIQKGYSIATPTLDGMGDLEQDGLFQAFREEGERARLAHLQFGPRDRPPVQKYYEYAQKTTYKRPPFRDHGVASALLLVKTWRDFDVYLDRLLAQPFPLHEQPNGAAAALQRISARVSALRDERRELGPRIMRAAGAMSLHNISPGQWNHLDAGTHGLTFDTFKIAIGAQSPETANPLAFLLAFVDTLQDWDRPTFSETPNENALHSHDLSITPDRYRKKVLVYVKRDAEEFIDPPTMKHSRYQRVVGCLKEYLDSDEVDSLIEWCRPEPPSKLEYALEPRESVLRPRSELDFNAVVNIPANDPWQWTVVLTRDEASRHGELMTSLRCSEMAGNSRFIDSGFAYWGIGPTIQWRRACTDDYYVVMRKGIATFSGRWASLLQNTTTILPSVYVSYGVGTGEKDHDVIATMSAGGTSVIYIPIDMSLDMLVNGAKAASRRLLAPGQVIPLQIDFSSPTELAMVVEIRNQVLRGQPMLFSLLGNTLANFEDDLTTLRTLTDVMQDGDALLLELATTREAGPTIVDMAVREYRNIPSFESFVRSALTQHTDLPTNEIEYEGSTCHDGGALQIDMNYVSVGESTGRLIDGSEIVLTPGEKIRLYRSRKYTLATIRHLLEQAGLREHGCFEHWNDRRNSPFGLYLGICRR